MSYATIGGKLFLKDIQEDQKHIDILKNQRTKLNQMSTEYRKMRVNNQRLVSENDQLRRAFDQLSIQSNKLDDETKRLIYDLRTDKDMLQGDLSLLREENHKLNQLIEEITENNDIWKSRNKELDSQVVQLRRDTEAKEDVINNLRDALTEMEASNARLEERNCKLSQVELNLERSEFNNKMLSKQVAELQNIREELEHRLNGEEQYHNDIQKNNNQTFFEKDKEIALLQDEVKCSIQELQSKAKLIDMQEDIISTLRQEVEALRDHHHTVPGLFATTS